MSQKKRTMKSKIVAIKSKRNKSLKKRMFRFCPKSNVNIMRKCLKRRMLLDSNMLSAPLNFIYSASTPSRPWWMFCDSKKNGKLSLDYSIKLMLHHLNSITLTIKSLQINASSCWRDARRCMKRKLWCWGSWKFRLNVINSWKKWEKVKFLKMNKRII